MRLDRENALESLGNPDLACKVDQAASSWKNEVKDEF